MAATSQDLKDFFALTGNNPPVTNAQLIKLSEWLADIRSLEAPATPDDFVDYVYQMVREQVIAHERRTTSITF